MPRRTFEQKWEELRREGKLQDMIAESSKIAERVNAPLDQSDDTTVEGDNAETSSKADAMSSGAFDAAAAAETTPHTAEVVTKQIRMHNALSGKVQWEDQPDKRCVLCLNDGTVSDDQKVSICPLPSAGYADTTN